MTRDDDRPRISLSRERGRRVATPCYRSARIQALLGSAVCRTRGVRTPSVALRARAIGLARPCRKIRMWRGCRREGESSGCKGIEQKGITESWTTCERPRRFLRPLADSPRGRTGYEATFSNRIQRLGKVAKLAHEVCRDVVTGSGSPRPRGARCGGLRGPGAKRPAVPAAFHLASVLDRPPQLDLAPPAWARAGSAVFGGLCPIPGPVCDGPGSVAARPSGVFLNPGRSRTTVQALSVRCRTSSQLHSLPRGGLLEDLAQPAKGIDRARLGSAVGRGGEGEASRESQRGRTPRDGREVDRLTVDHAVAVLVAAMPAVRASLSEPDRKNESPGQPTC